MKKYKILLVHRTLRQSGASRQVIALYHNLDRARFEPVFVVRHTRQLAYRDLLADAPIHMLNDGRIRRGRGRGLLRRIVELRSLMAIIDRERPDCIQSFNPRSNLILYLASFLRRLPPIYTSVRNTNQSFKSLLCEVFFKRRHRGLVVNSRGIRNQLVSAGIHPSRIRLIENGVDCELFEPATPSRRAALRTLYEVGEHEFLILSVCRVHRQKDLATVLSAVASLVRDGVPARFVNLGLLQDESYHEELMRLAEDEGILSKCEFIESTPHVTDYYHIADAFVLASNYEGLSNALLENMASGGLSVISSAADNDELVRHAENGFLFPVGDSVQLARVLHLVLGLTANESQTIGEAARKDTLQRFSLERMAESFAALYEEG
jgi:glycosyltransferase involved in cell wall biosynthesis